MIFMFAAAIANHRAGKMRTDSSLLSQEGAAGNDEQGGHQGEIVVRTNQSHACVSPVALVAASSRNTEVANVPRPSVNDNSTASSTTSRAGFNARFPEGSNPGFVTTRGAIACQLARRVNIHLSATALDLLVDIVHVEDTASTIQVGLVTRQHRVPGAGSYARIEIVVEHEGTGRRDSETALVPGESLARGPGVCQ
jgi:hypothetical protein